MQLLTRVPTPGIAGFQPDWVARSARYYPLVGALVGAVAALVLLGAARLWTGALPALLAVAGGVLLTGAFHEDGLADTRAIVAIARSVQTGEKVMLADVTGGV